MLPVCLGAAALLSSCSAFDDFLTVYPTDKVTGEQFWEDKNDVTSVLAATYRNMASTSIIQRMMVWGEIRSENFVLSSASSDKSITDIMNIMNANLLPSNDWYNYDGFYRTIGYANLLIGKGQEMVDKEVDPSFRQGDWQPIDAECRAIRALNYFYLIRTFRNVPLEVNMRETSQGARDPMPQSTSREILDFLIDDLEAVKDYGMSSFGENEAPSNRGRFTRAGIYTLLADLYLWRAASENSDTVAVSTQNADYRRVIELCDYVIESKMDEFRRYVRSGYSLNYYGQRDAYKKPSPLIMPSGVGRLNDDAYDEIFGDGNSIESIFELQFYNSSEGCNNAVANFYGYGDGSSTKDGYVASSTLLSQTSGTVNASAQLYSKTDIRMAEAITYTAETSTSATSSRINKYTTKAGLTITDATNVWSKSNDDANVKYGSIRQKDSYYANWIIYRASDVMLMKAEAIACLGVNGEIPEGDQLLEDAFDLVFAVFNRSNPRIEGLNDTKNLEFAEYSTPDKLLELVMSERQREFYGEGKRWYDLVRMALRDGSNTQMLELLVRKYSANRQAIMAKLATINSLFSPFHEDEMKINTALVQNPVWKADEMVQRN